MVTDQNGNVVARHDSVWRRDTGGIAGRNSQFGPGLDNVNQKFTGQERDTETNFDFFKSRYANGGMMGRFISPDPAGMAAADATNPQSWNEYAYVMNSPLTLINPSGLAPTGSGNGDAEGCTYLDSGETCWAAMVNDGGGSGVPTFQVTARACQWWQFWCYLGQGDVGQATGSGAEGLTGLNGPTVFSITRYGVQDVQTVSMTSNEQLQLSPPKNGTPKLYCQPDIIVGMKKIWAQSGNGMNGTEASFNVNGSPDNYSIFFNPFTNQKQSQSFRLQFDTFANFHVHPNSGSWQPSTPSNNATSNGLGDVGNGNRTGIQIYVVSRQGLGFYDPKTKLIPIRLRPGMDWIKPCGN